MCPSDADIEQDKAQRIKAKSYHHLSISVKLKLGMKSMLRLSVADTLIAGSRALCSSIRILGDWWLIDTRTGAQYKQLD